MHTNHKTALITGAVERIGAAVARALHERGLDVLVHCRTQRKSAAALLDGLNDIRPHSARVLCADLATPAGVEKLAQACLQHTDRLHVLVNNASRFYPTVVGETQPDQWDDLINSNLRAAYFLSQGLVGPLRAAGGAIINILDIHAQQPMRGHAVYCIAKAGLAMMTRAMARELAPAIRVNGVSPGAILWPQPAPDEAAKRRILSRIALGRIGHPADIASAVVYLALDAPYVTGQILSVDGGRSLNM
jgi:pteridine reductase